MKFLQPRFWHDNNSILANLLRPISFMFYFFTVIKKTLSIKTEFQTPIICIGNIYVGGTGKTPVSIMIANEFKNIGKKPAIIKKYYIDQKDEHKMIIDQTNCLFLGNSRCEAIKKAEEENSDIIILDDGFQDHTIQQKLNIICFNDRQLVGNGFLFPAGPLRESLSSLKRAQIVIINGKKNKKFEKKIFDISKNIKIFYAKYIPKNAEQFKGKNLCAFAGIGNPDNFFHLLSDYNLNVKRKISFPDHYEFKKEELDKMVREAISNNFKLITTEKDFYRIKGQGFNEIEYLKIDLEIQEKSKLVKEVLKYL